MRRVLLLSLIALGMVGGLFLAGCHRDRATTATQSPASADGAFPLTLTDSLDRTVTIPACPQRIVSLAPSTTEILFAIGAGDRVIADTTYCDYPEAAKALPKIGGYVNPNIEQIVALQPDIVVGARGNERAAIDQLANLGLPVVTVAAESLAEVEAAIRLVGQSVGANEAAEKLADDCASRREATAQATAGLADRPRTLLLFSQDTLFTAGPGSHLDEMITLAGGENVAAAAKTPWPELSMETVVTADPEIIILLSGHGEDRHLKAEAALKRFRADTRWRALNAVTAGRIVVLNDDELTLPGPRLVDGLDALAAALHPEVFAMEAPQ